MTEKRKTWRIPVTWEMSGFVEVETNTLAEAIAMVEWDMGETIPLPDDGNYVEDSWKVIPDDPEEIRESYNNNQQDGE